MGNASIFFDIASGRDGGGGGGGGGAGEGVLGGVAAGAGGAGAGCGDAETAIGDPRLAERAAGGAAEPAAVGAVRLRPTQRRRQWGKMHRPPPDGDLQAKSDTGESCSGKVGFMGGAALEKSTEDGVDGVFQARDA